LQKALSASDKDIERISNVAARYALTSKTPGSRKMMLLAKAVSPAPVEVLEGQPRMLRRKIRRPTKIVTTALHEPAEIRQRVLAAGFSDHGSAGLVMAVRSRDDLGRGGGKARPLASRTTP
jgi:hypothetical protein